MTKVRGCIFCGARADLLCDGELGYMGVTDTTGKEPRLCIDIQQRLKCDVEIYQACATRKGGNSLQNGALRVLGFNRLLPRLSPAPQRRKHRRATRRYHAGCGGELFD